MAVGRTHSIQDAAMASACGARSAMARNPCCGRGTRGIRLMRNRRFTEKPLLEDPILGGSAQLLQPSLTPRFAIDANNWLRSRQAVADPRSIAEDELQSVLTNDVANLMPAKLVRIGLQLFSELRPHLRRQSEVLPLRKERTNLVTDVIQLLAQ